MLECPFNKVAALQACNFIKKRLQHRLFPVNIAKLLRTPILKNICERLLLKTSSKQPLSHRGFNADFILFFLSLAVLNVLTSSGIAIIVSAQFAPVFIVFIQMQFLYALYLINFTFNDFIFLITDSGFNQQIITHILDIVLIAQSHIFFSEIHIKFMKFLIVIFLIGRWLVSRWSVGRWSVGRWSVVGGRLIGGFKKTR